MQRSHPDLGAGLLEADPRLGEQIEHVGVSALGRQVDRGEARLILVIRGHAVHEPRDDDHELRGEDSQQQHPT